MAEDTFTKGWLIKWLEGVPDDTNIALEIKEFGQLDFIVTDPNGQDRVLRVAVIPPNEREQIDLETNEQ
jgi:hypothetical protein